MNKTPISFFERANQVRPAQVELGAVLSAIKNGAIKAKIEEIRAANATEQEKLKKNLPGVTFGGTFKTRSMKGLIKASGFLCLDFDTEGYVCPPELNEYVYASFRSPRGGLKALVRIPVVENDEQFKELFRALEAKFKDIDPSGKDISRICFMSYDPDLYVNPEAKTWEERITAPVGLRNENPSDPAPAQRNPVQSQTNWAKVALGLKMIKTAQVGNRHNNCLKAGQLMGGYVATGEISMDDIETLVREIEATSTEPQDHVRAFRDGVEYGKGLPLRSEKRGEADVYKVRKAIKEEWNASEKIGNISYSIEDIDDKIEEKWRNGTQRGYTTGWANLDGHYSILLGYMSIIYGAPTMGKSLLQMNLLMNLSRLHGFVHTLFTPEMGTPDEVYCTLLQIHAGKDLDNTYGNRMTREELDAAKKFVGDHFIILDNEETGDEVTIETLCLYVDFLERKINKRIHTITVDPLIELMAMTADTRDDIYWNGELKKARVMAKSGNRHLFLIHHSKDPGRPAGRDDFGNPVYPSPPPFEIAFGQTFYRKAFFLIGVWYHYCEGARPGDLIELKAIKKVVRVGYSYVKIWKAKPEGAGERGEVALRFSKRDHRYYDDEGVAPEPIMARNPSEPQREIDFTPHEHDREAPSWPSEPQREIDFTPHEHDREAPSWLTED